MRPVELKPYLESIAQVFAGLAERSGIDFDRQFAEAPVTVYADPDQLEKVVTNLLSNAFKFTPAGGRIALALSSTETIAQIEVRDTGAGISTDELPHIFDRFYQSESSVRSQQPGTGIGLTLARELVVLHGGNLSVESTAGRGTVFLADIPLGRAHFADKSDVEISDEPLVIGQDVAQDVEEWVTPANGKPAADDDPDQTTILIVDDNEEIRAFVRRHLAPHFRIREASDGLEGLAMARQSPPDAIVSDVMMPNLDGLGLLRALREDPDLDFVPIILLTARAELSDKLAGLEYGADDYLTKPFDIEELLARIRNLISLRHRLLREPVSTVEPASSTPAVQSDEDLFRTQLEQIMQANLMDESFNVDGLAGMMGHVEANAVSTPRRCSGPNTGRLSSVRATRTGSEFVARQGR